ncbi:MAG: helix-turn-helix domain-containing protein [Campylobacterales bacterium]|nr:helix-turn-helix domain-containing protein [Campylobacterales bacterium]
MSENIVKKTAKELGMTQKELAEAIGAAEATVRNWASGKEVPEWALKSMRMLCERQKDKEIIDTLKKLQNLISER